MEISLIKIGNSQGIRLPKSMIQEYGFKDKIEVTQNKGEVILKPIKNKKIRENWEEKFKKYSKENSEDHEFKSWENFSNNFDKTEAEWK